MLEYHCFGDFIMEQLPTSLALLFSLTGTVGKLTKKADRALSVHGISLSEFMVLHHLNYAQNQVMSRTELADAVNLTASGVTRLLTPLEKIHLVEKEKNNRDARVSLVKLTFTGRDIYKYAFLSCKSTLDEVVREISPKQLSTVLEVLNKLA
jgi:DNA-binding MarR family transcriptional regulator